MDKGEQTKILNVVPEKEKKYSPIQHKPCQICGGKATGYHFGVVSCEACKSFFRRSLKRKKEPICEKDGNCPTASSEVVGIPCPACRLRKCMQEGMSENAVKKGRYSLDRRAEAILESRQYWGKTETPRSAYIKEETKERNNSNSSVTSPCYISRGSSVTSQATRSSGDSTISPQPQLQTSGNAELSTDDIFTILNEVYAGDEMVGGATCDNSSTIDTASLSSLFSTTATPNIAQNNTTTNATASSNNFRPELQFSCNYTNTSHLEQFALKGEYSQTPGAAPYQDPRNIGPHLLSESEIKQELPPTPSPSNSGNGVSPNSYSSASPANLQEISPPSSQYTPGATATFSFHMPGADTARTVPLQQVPPIQPVQPMLNPSSSASAAVKKREPQNVDALCKLLLSDFKVKDDQDYIIDEIVAAFDRQNFTNKGFLAKVSDQQHKYLEGQKEEEKMFGPMAKLNSQEFIEMFKETGVDLDGRLKIMQQHADVLDQWVKQVMQFYKGIPGFTDLPLKDQMALIKGSNIEFITCTYFPYVGVKTGVEVSAWVPDCVINIEMAKSWVDNVDEQIDEWLLLVERLQNLQITDREYTMMTALFVIEPEECVTESGKEQCRQLAGKLDDAFRHLLKKRLSYDRTDEIMMNIKEIRALLRPISRKYNVEYFTSMKQYSEHCGIKYGELTWQYYEI